MPGRNQKSRARILGLATYDFLFNQVKAIASGAKNMMPDLLIIAGGPTPTFAGEKVLKNIPEIDIVARGEGEETIYELYLYIKGEKKLGEIKGITYRENDNIVINPDRPLIGLDGPRGANLMFFSHLLKKGYSWAQN